MIVYLLYAESLQIPSELPVQQNFPRTRPRRKTAPKTQQLSAPTTDVVLGPEDAVGGELGLGHAVGADLGLDDAIWVEPRL